MSTAQATQAATPVRSPRLFPLYLTPFEEYMLWDDRVDYPMTFIVKMEFDGEIDRHAITRALPLALDRHPLLQAIVQPAKGNRDCWVAAPNPHVEISWGEIGEPLELPKGEAIDLRSEVGLRVWIRTGEGRCVITTQFHHATCDGIGAYQLLGDWLWFYADLVGEPVDAPLPDFDPLQLRMRVKASYNVERYRDANGKITFDRPEAYRLAIQTMHSLSTKRGKRETPAGDKPEPLFPGLCDFEFDKLRYKKLRHVAEARGQATNELLIQQLLVSLNTWSDLQGDRHRGKYCIMMPMDLREADTRLSTAANLVTYALIRRRRSECVDTPQLIDSLAQELLKLKHTRHTTPFMNVMAFLTRVPTWLKRGFAGRRRLATAIVSNTGDPTKRFSVSFPSVKGLLKAGNLLMTDINGVPPMRNGTRLTISVFTYRRVLKICLRCDPQRFSVEDSRDFLNHYVASIENLLADA
ncbi:chromosome condensation protein [Aporhodopirellula aestuarii]|uniref:Chromosome condensation protein n=1 Tax=Aporhodopirellula aestuarii TaxID=2950107 RepID=A0ABT0UCH7_9BACT|nr:chromosome condensation protein [Aporhodopirellula aestuarii]MCM2374734.1 chromosome condensation protein [Aporhodopirellula aestuarii]